MCDVVVPRELRLLKALIPLEERALACPDRLCRGADSSTDSNGALACPDVLCRGHLSGHLRLVREMLRGYYLLVRR